MTDGPVQIGELPEALIALQEICAQKPPVAAAGDVIASGEFTDEFRLLQGHIRQTLRHKIGTQNTEELTQAALVKVWENQDKFAAGNILGWSGTLATRVAIDSYRKTSRTIPKPHDDIVFTTMVADDDTEQIALEAGSMERINKLMDDASVSETFRDTIRLYALGKGQTEIAQILKIRRGTAASKLHKGLAQLRKYLETETTPSDDMDSRGVYSLT